PRWFLSVRRRGHQAVLRRAQADVLPRRDLHAFPWRPAPGPSRRLGAHVEYVSPSPHPGIRGAEVRRRPRIAQLLRPLGRRHVALEDPPPVVGVPVTEREALVHGGHVPWADAAAWRGTRGAGRLRRSVLRAHARARG